MTDKKGENTVSKYSVKILKESIKRHPICFICNNFFKRRRDVVFFFRNKNKQDYHIDNLVPMHRFCYREIILSQRGENRGATAT